MSDWLTCWCGRAKAANRAVCDRCASTGPIREPRRSSAQQEHYGHHQTSRTIALTAKYHAERQAEIDAANVRRAQQWLFGARTAARSAS